jgi:cob(I)alamin adenosyltransferase
MSKGFIHVYTGESKGKTTAAFGLAMRAAGHGKNVLILQFLKSRIRNSGEAIAAKKCGITVIKFKGQTSPLFDPTVKREELKRKICRAIDRSIKHIKSGKYDLVILDEINNAVGNGYACSGDIQKIIDSKPEGLELVFTGRNAPKELIDAADYVTEMHMIKHPAIQGVKARKGIEF